jgi:hypothetical protein
MNMWLDGYYFQNMESGITHAVKRPILLSFHTIGKFGDDIMKIMKKELESGIEQLDNPVMIKEAITTIPKIWSELGQGLKQKYEDQVDVKDIIKIIGKYEPQIKAEHLRALEAERLQRENISASIGIQNLLKRANVGNLYTPPLIQQRRSRLVFDYAPAVAAPAVAAPAVAAPATPIPKSAELKEFERLRKLGQLLEYELRDLNIFKYLTECHKSKNATGLPMPCNLVDWVIWTWDIEGRGYQGAEDELDYLEQKYFLSKDAKNKIFFSENETERLHELRAAKSEKSSAPEEQLGGQGNAPVPGAPVSWRELGKSIGKSGIAPIQTQGSDDDLRKMIAALEDGDNDLAASIFNSRFSKYKLSLIPKLQEALKSKNSSRVERVLNEESKARRLDNLVPKLVEELMEGGREGALGLLGEERYKQEVEKILPEILDQVEEGDITGAHKTLTRHMRRLRQLDHRKRGGKRSEKRGIFGGGIFGSSGGGGSDGGGGGVSTGVSIRSISFQPQERQWNRRHH